MPTDAELAQLSTQVGNLLLATGKILTTAESCTGGWIAKAITDIAGSSSWFEQGVVTYSNQAKQILLGVDAELLQVYGAVSEPVARAMAQGALVLGGANWAVAVSGIAGPGGAVPGKPVGTVCFAWAADSGLIKSTTCHFDGDREAVRRQSVQTALSELIKQLENK